MWHSTANRMTMVPLSETLGTEQSNEVKLALFALGVLGFSETVPGWFWIIAVFLESFLTSFFEDTVRTCHFAVVRHWLRLETHKLNSRTARQWEEDERSLFITKRTRRVESQDHVRINRRKWRMVGHTAEMHQTFWGILNPSFSHHLSIPRSITQNGRGTRLNLW